MKGCYSKGGKIRPKTIHGLRTGQHNNPNVLRAARACGGSVTHKDGERAKRADGGRTTISQDSKDAVSKLRKDEREANSSALGSTAMGIMSGIGRAGLRHAPRPLKWLANTSIGANALGAIGGINAGERAKTEADRIEKGLVKPGEEDRKDGGRVGRKNGGPLNAKRRNALPSKDFAGPDRSYPINDANHARNALARASQHASPKLRARIQAKVAKKYPGIKQGD